MSKYKLIMKKGTNQDCKTFADIVFARQKWFISKSHPQWNDISKYYHEKYYLSKLNNFYCFFDGAELVGGCLLLAEDNFWENNNKAIYLHSFVNKIGCGRGKEAFSLIYDWAVACGYKYIRIDCMGSNQKLIDIYLSYGFEIKGWDKYNGGDSACLMEYKL